MAPLNPPGRVHTVWMDLKYTVGVKIREAEGAKDPITTCVHQNAHTECTHSTDVHTTHTWHRCAHNTKWHRCAHNIHTAQMYTQHTHHTDVHTTHTQHRFTQHRNMAPFVGVTRDMKTSANDLGGLWYNHDSRPRTRACHLYPWCQTSLHAIHTTEPREEEGKPAKFFSSARPPLT